MNIVIKFMIISALISGLSFPVLAAKDEDGYSAKGEKPRQLIAVEEETPDLNPQNTPEGKEEKAEAEIDGPSVSVQKERKPKKILEKDLPDPELGEAKASGNLETLEGRVSGAGYNGLAVELPNPKKDEPSEIWFDYVKGIKLSSVQGLEEIQEGDTVRVSYIKGEDGRKFLQEIRRTRKKPAEEILVSTETSEATGE